MKVNELQILYPTELACELTETIAAQVFAVCSLENRSLDAGVLGMSVDITPRDLNGAISTLRMLIDRLTHGNPAGENPLSNRTVLDLKRLGVLLEKIDEHTYVRTNEDAWTNESEDDDE